MVITNEVAEKIFNWRSQGISVSWISYYLGISENTIISHLRLKSYEKELYEAMPNLKRRSNFCSTSGYCPEKIKYIVNTMKKNINLFDAILIIGFEHCKSIVNLMDQTNKKIIGNDVRESVFSRYPQVQKIVKDAVDLEFRDTLDEIKRTNSRCAAYVNLTGKADLIEYVFSCDFNPIVAVVYDREDKTRYTSSLNRCKDLGFKTYHLSKKTYLAIYEKKE
jgi:hypothetical protein